MPFMAKTLANGIAWYVRTPQDAEEQDHRLIVICSIFTVHKFLYFDTRERKRKNRHSNERTETKEHTICFFCKKTPQPLLFRSSSLAFPASCPRAARSKPPNRQVRHQISRASQEQEPSVPFWHIYFLLTRQLLPICIEASLLAHSVPIQFPSASRSIIPMPRLASQTLAAAGGTACIA
jgi:hypothetical protein